MPRDRDPFDWSGGHPALDLVNTLDERPFPWPVERLRDYCDLLRFTELAGLIDRETRTRLGRLAKPGQARVVAQARSLRERLHTVLVAWHGGQPIPDDALRGVALAVRRAHAARGLVAADGAGGVALHNWLAPGLDVPLLACALSAEDLLVAADPDRLRECRATDCGVFFLDTSKAGRRRWCSMDNCGNREKQRRWRAEVG